MGINGYDNVKGMLSVWSGVFNETRERFAATADWKKIADEVPSSTEENNYWWLDRFPGLRKWTGDRFIHNISADAHKVKNEEYEVTIEIPKNKVDDLPDLFGISKMFEMSAWSTEDAIDQFIFDKLIAGFDDLGYDGVPFFSADHPSVNGGTQSNTGGGAGEPWFLLNTSLPIKPLFWQKREELDLGMRRGPEETLRVGKYMIGGELRGAAAYSLWQLAYASRQNLEKDTVNAALATMGSYKDWTSGQNGQPIKYLKSKPTYLITTPANEAKAFEVFGAPMVNNTNNGNYNKVQVIITPYVIMP